MTEPLSVKRNTLVATTIVVGLIIALSFVESVNSLFAITMIIWAWMFTYSVVNIKQSPLLFCFLISFFVFLLGRQFCYHYLHMDQVYEFLDETNNETYTYLITSMLGLTIGYYLSTRIIKESPNNKMLISSFVRGHINSYQLACKTMFYACYCARLIATIMQIRYVQSVGYLASYTEEMGGVKIPILISYFSRFMPVVICLYLGTKPPKKKTILPLLLYEGYAMLTLMTGQRYPFIGVSMFILIYFILRSKDEKGWIKKYYYFFILIGVPALLFFLTAYDSIRLGSDFSFEGYNETIKDFLVSQGGSVNVIRRTILYENQLKDMKLVSFPTIYSVVFENQIGRRLFNIISYSGNSVEHAMNSNSLAHRLSYITYGNEYLSGKGTGTSYIAELLHDFGVVGVLIGSFLYGFLISKIDRIEFDKEFVDGIKLAMVYYLLFAPRGDFDSFIGSVFNMCTIIGFIIIVLLTSFLSRGQVVQPTYTEKENNKD